jgi:ADP-ribose pyrophosphatase YjhB (NUDIX family)
MKKYIRKVAAVMIRDKKLLLVRGKDKLFFWTPGGKIEEKETPEETLIRELEEELNIASDDIEFKSYFTYLSEKEEDGFPRKVYCYIVNYNGDIVLGNEVEEVFWMSKEDFLKSYSKLQIGVKEQLIPKLIEDKFL